MAARLVLSMNSFGEGSSRDRRLRNHTAGRAERSFGLGEARSQELEKLATALRERFVSSL